MKSSSHNQRKRWVKRASELEISALHPGYVSLSLGIISSQKNLQNKKDKLEINTVKKVTIVHHGITYSPIAYPSQLASSPSFLL